MALKITKDQAIAEVGTLTESVAKGIKRLRELKAKFPSLKSGTYVGVPGSILNAYREGDMTWDEAVDALNEIRLNTIREVASTGL